ncbi:MAG: SpoVA/SpoVAEb family sporulation membrane protein [Bacilli bacterium]
MNKESMNICKKVIESNPVKRPIIKNAIKAFIIGGIVGLISEGLIDLFTNIFNIETKIANSLMSMTLVAVTSLLTGVGIFDKLGQFSGAGTFIPITGFANSMTSSALEGKSEGVVLGIMSNMFKLAGAVIVAGVVSAFISGTIIFLLRGI